LPPHLGGQELLAERAERHGLGQAGRSPNCVASGKRRANREIFTKASATSLRAWKRSAPDTSDTRSEGIGPLRTATIPKRDDSVWQETATSRGR
jgi:hypothetical protein